MEAYEVNEGCREDYHASYAAGAAVNRLMTEESSATTQYKPGEDDDDPDVPDACCNCVCHGDGKLYKSCSRTCRESFFGTIGHVRRQMCGLAGQLKRCGGDCFGRNSTSSSAAALLMTDRGDSGCCGDVGRTFEKGKGRYSARTKPRGTERKQLKGRNHNGPRTRAESFGVISRRK